MNQIKYAPTSALKPHPLNAAIYGDGCDQDLLDSIKEKGIVNPILVTKSFQIISGHRRFNAAQMTGLNEVPVIIMEQDDPLEVEELLIVTNKQRNKTAEQMAREYDKLKDIEKIKAKNRQIESGKNFGIGKEKVVENSPQPISEGKSRELAAEKLGISSNTAERAAKVVHHVDELRAEGKTEEAEALRQTLNEKSVNAAYQQIKPKKEPAKPVEKTDPSSDLDNMLKEPENEEQQELPWRYMDHVPTNIKEFFINPITEKKAWVEITELEEELDLGIQKIKRYIPTWHTKFCFNNNVTTLASFTANDDNRDREWDAEQVLKGKIHELKLKKVIIEKDENGDISLFWEDDYKKKKEIDAEDKDSNDDEENEDIVELKEKLAKLESEVEQFNIEKKEWEKERVAIDNDRVSYYDKWNRIYKENESLKAENEKLKERIDTLEKEKAQAQKENKNEPDGSVGTTVPLLIHKKLAREKAILEEKLTAAKKKNPQVDTPQIELKQEVERLKAELAEIKKAPQAEEIKKMQIVLK